jgi:hypothetical protein
MPETKTLEESVHRAPPEAEEAAYAVLPTSKITDVLLDCRQLD